MKKIIPLLTALSFSLVLPNAFAVSPKDNNQNTVINNSPSTTTFMLVDVESRTDLSEVNFAEINKQLKTSSNTSDVTSLYGTVVGQKIIVLSNSALNDTVEYSDMTKSSTPQIQGGAAPNDVAKTEWSSGFSLKMDIKDANEKKVYATINFINNIQISTDPKTNVSSIKSTTFNNTLLLNKNEYQLVTVNSVYNEDPTATKQKSKMQFVFIKIQK
jgi:hypothetical protein